MPVSLTTITGPIYLPNGATPVGGRVSFELSSWDQEEGSGLLITGPVYSVIDQNGQFSVQLYTSTAGVNSVHYRMFVIWEDSELSESYVNDIYIGTPTPHYTKKYIGSFVLSGPGPFQVSDLNIVSEVSNSSFDAYLEMKAFADRIDLNVLDDAVGTTQANAVQTAADRATVVLLASEVEVNAVQVAADVTTTSLNVIASENAQAASEAVVEIVEGHAAMTLADRNVVVPLAAQVAIDAAQVAADKAAVVAAELAVQADMLTTIAARDASLLSRGLYASTAQGIGRGLRALIVTAAGSGGTNGTATWETSGGTAVIIARGTATIVGGAIVAVTVDQPGLYTVDPTGITLTGAGALAGHTFALTIGVNTPLDAYFSVPVAGSDTAATLYRVNAGPVATAVTTYASSALAIALREARLMMGLAVQLSAVVPAAGSVTPQVFRAFTPTNGKAYSVVARFPRQGLRYVHIINSAVATNGGMSCIFDCQTNTLVTTVGTGVWRDLGGDVVEVVLTCAVVSAAASANYVLRVSSGGVVPYAANGTDFKPMASLKLVEAGTVTNLWPSDNVADASFTKGSATISTVTTSEIDLLGTRTAANSTAIGALQEQVAGAVTAARLVEAAGVTNSRMYKSVAITSGLTYRHVIDIKRGARKWAHVTSGSGALWKFSVNLETGEYIRDANAIYAPATISTEYIGNGFWRIDISVVATATIASNLQVCVLGDDLVWPSRTGDGVSDLYVNSVETYQSGVLLWRAVDFSTADWTKDGVTVTENFALFGGVRNDLRYQPAMVDISGDVWATVPNGGDGVYGPGKVTLNGMPHFTPGAPKGPDLHHALRAALAVEIGYGAPIMFLGDSITWATHERDRRRNFVDMFTAHLNQGSPLDEPVLHAVADYLLPTHGITIAGTRANGTTGPLAESLVMQPGCVLTFTGAYAQVDAFYNQAVGAGALEFAYNGVVYKTQSCAGVSDLDHYSGPSLTGQTASGTYTITCTGAAVEITGIDRLGAKEVGSLARVRVFRWAHGSYNFAHFNATCITSALKQASAISATPPMVIMPLGINERQAVGAAGLASMKTRYQDLLTRLTSAGVTNIVAQMPVRTSAAADAGFYAAALPYDQLIAGMTEVLRTNNIPTIATHVLNLPLAGKMDADGIHPTEAGLYDMAQMLVEGLCRIREVI